MPTAAWRAGRSWKCSRASRPEIGSIEDLIRYRLHNEHTIERLDVRDIDTEHGPFRLHTYRDPDQPLPALRAAARRTRPGRSDARPRAHAEPAGGRAALAPCGFRPGGGRRAGQDRCGSTWCAGSAWARRRPRKACSHASASSRNPLPVAAAWPSGAATAPARRSGDLGLGKLRVLGTPRKQVGLAGFGLSRGLLKRLGSGPAALAWKEPVRRGAPYNAPPSPEHSACLISKATCAPPKARVSRSSSAAGTRASPSSWSPAPAKPSSPTASPRMRWT